LVAAVGLFLPAQAWGVVVGDDPNLHVVTSPSAYDGVAYLSSAGGASAVLINPWYILTANHAASVGGTATFHINGTTQTFIMEEKFSSPSADLAVVRLNRSTGLTGYSLYDPNVYGSEVGQGGTILGYGMSGTPATVGAGGDPNFPRGTLRKGYNRIDAIIPSYSSYGDCLQMVFDSPSSPNSLGITKESMVALGDSGGPVFIEAGGSLRVAGIHVAIARYDVDHWPKYGDYSYHVRTAAYSSWIDGKTAEVPATQTGDFDNNGAVNASDIDALFAHRGTNDLWYDVSGDGNVSNTDVDTLLHAIIGTEYGDFNLDHKVDLTDYNTLASHYGLTGTAGWAIGDLNGDKAVTFADYQILEMYFGFGTDDIASAPPIPEPATLALLTSGALLLGRRTKPRRGA
jgi:hypothetical protein